MERRLAAILAADVVGFSRLMEEDEAGAFAALKALRADLVDPKIADRRGRIVKLMGDGMLVEFPSVVEAVECAVDIQRAMAERSGDRRIEFRVGVNLGDVIVDGDDIYGDGVNLAARLEGLADPGGVCVSAMVWDQLHGKMETEFVAVGERQVKNIARAIGIFAWHPSGVDRAPAEASVAEPGRKPTVALGAFEAVGRSEEVDILAASVRDATAASLANQTGMTVLSDTAVADYVASAKIQALGQRSRATVHILDRQSGIQFASERFDGVLVDLFEAEDALAYRIYMSIRFAVYQREVEQAAGLPPDAQSSEMLIAQAG